MTERMRAAAGAGPGGAPGLGALPLGLHGLRDRRRGQRPVRRRARPERADPGVQGDHRATSGPGAGRAGRTCWRWWPTTGSGPGSPAPPGPAITTTGPGDGQAAPGGRARPGGVRLTTSRLFGPLTDPAGDAGYAATTRRGWGSSPTPRSASAARPARSPARSGTAPGRRARPARHVLRQHRRARREHLAARRVHRAARRRRPAAGSDRAASAVAGSAPADAATAGVRAGRRRRRPARTGEFRWLMSSDVCKHCTHAGCLDVCPTGALFRTEFGTVVVQQDICNGCGYCVSGLPVRRHRRGARTTAGPGSARCATTGSRTARSRPARRPARPSRSSSATWTSCASGPRPGRRSCTSRASPRPGSTAQDPNDGVGGDGAFFLLLDEPEVYGLPPDPVVPTRDLPRDVDARRDGGGALVAVAARRSFGGTATGDRARRRRGAAASRRGDGGGAGEELDGAATAEFRSYYGRPILKPPAWEDDDRRLLLPRRAGRRVALLAAGADLTGRPALRRGAGSAALGALGAGATAWSPTSAGRSGSTTCCGWPSRPRR